MIKFLAVIDYKASKGYSGFEKVDLHSNDLISAMSECEKLLCEDVYLIRIAKKTGKTMRINGEKVAKYTEILCNRGSGWHACDNEHCEEPFTWARHESVKYKDFITYEIA